eukprot:7843422-Alexandrium_andersonii.AAC.1
MCIRDRNGPLRGSKSAEIQRLGDPHNAYSSVSGKWGSEFLQVPNRGEGRLARRASWDRDLSGRILRPRPILTGGLSDGIGSGAYDYRGSATSSTPGGAPRA